MTNLDTLNALTFNGMEIDVQYIIVVEHTQMVFHIVECRPQVSFGLRADIIDLSVSVVG